MRDPAATVVQETPAAPGPAPAPRGRLFRKYVAFFVAVVSVALVLNGGFEIWFSYQEHQAALIRIQREQADAAAAKIGQFIKEIESQLGWTTQLPWSAGTVEQRRFDALRLLRQVPAITELAQLDSAGKEQLKVSRLAMDVLGSGIDQSSEPKFTETVAKKVYYGPVYFRRESEPYMTLALAGTRRDAGISIAEVNLKFIWDVVSQIKVGEKGQAFVVDQRGRLIAHPDISLVLRNTDMASLPQVKAALGEASPREAAQEAKNLQGKEVLTAASMVVPLGWRVFVELPRDEAYAPLYAATGRSAALLIGGLLLALLAALFLARRMAGPIQRLRAGAARIGEGDLSERISIKTGDELESLADQFNDMAGRLQESYADLEEKVEVRTHELSESLQQQTATAEVLKVISRSTFELQPVLDTLVQSAAELCDADQAAIFVMKNGLVRFAAHHGYPPEWVERVTADPTPVTGSSLASRTVAEARTISISDVLEDPSYTRGTLQNFSGSRSLLGVPLLRGGVAIGMFSLARKIVKPFTDKQIELVTTFADQAVIAIENVRLFDEVQARTVELTESLEQQTATSEVLQVISGSPGELEPVFETLLANATRICGAKFGTLNLYDGEVVRLAAHYNTPPAFIEARRGIVMAPHPESGLALVAKTKQIVQIEDLRTQASYLEGHPVTTAMVDLGGARTIVVVPMLKEGDLVGSFSIYRQEVQPFSDKQIALLKSFANQAVIAIENARLLKEIRERTDDLTESLRQQTVTSEVLRVMSTSPTDVQPVFEAIVRNAVALCDGLFANVFRFDGEMLHFVASHNVWPSYVERLKAKYPMRPDSSQVSGRVMLTKSVVRVEDVLSDPEYDQRFPATMQWRRMLGVPMMREDVALGVIVVGWAEAGSVSKAQEELLKTFADQAAIGIENVRLFDEVQARTGELARSVEELRALGEVTQAVNTTLDLQTVLDTIVAKAVQLSGTDAGAIYVFSNLRQKFRLRATYGMSEAMIESIGEQTVRLGDGPIGEAAASRKPAQVADLRAGELSPIMSVVYGAGYRALLAIPLIRLDRVIGALVVRRLAPGAFSDATVSLLETFAAQSVLAIQNARLFADIEEKGRELEMASKHKSQFLANMSHELRTPMNAVLGFAEMLADGLYGELPQKAKGALERVQVNGRHLLGLINDVLDLSKIEAGQLALALDDYSVGQVVQTVVAGTEALARNKGLALTAKVGDGLPIGYGDERRLTQVLLNLVGNAIKFTDKGEVAIEAKVADGLFELSVRDTGAGIALEHQQRIFEEFQQVDDSNTRQKGGTGLGLAISKRIVELHGGAIRVASKEGVGSTFFVTLPVRAADSKEAAE